MQNREELRQKGTIGVKKTTCCKSEKISLLEGGGE
jgi:hypothetical protein